MKLPTDKAWEALHQAALTPILINVLIVDLQTTLSNVTLVSAAFYLIRVAALCGAACSMQFPQSGGCAHVLP